MQMHITPAIKLTFYNDDSFEITVYTKLSEILTSIWLNITQHYLQFFYSNLSKITTGKMTDTNSKVRLTEGGSD